MKRLALLALSCPIWCSGASSVHVFGVTNTQAVIQATLDDSTSCTIEVSESPGYAPLVHDVDASLFPGANSCFRPGSSIAGNSVTMVIGARWADWDSSGAYAYSRALHAASKHYYRITTPASVTTGSFDTATISMGRTFMESLPMDPNHIPHYRLPMFTSLTDQTETLIDPLTGVAIRRISMPRVLYADNTGNSNKFTWALDSSGQWSNPAYALNPTITAGAYATFTGRGSGAQPWLFVAIQNPSWNIGVTPNDWTNEALSMDWFWTQFQGHISSTACTGDDCKIEVCLTVDGNSCWSKTVEGILTGTDSAVAVGGQTDMTPWRKPYSELLPTPYTGNTTSTNASIDASGIITWTAGDRFRPHWTNGSWVRLNSGPWCQVNRVLSNGNQLQLQNTTCATSNGISLPAAGITVFGANFGLLVRKKTSTPDTISIGASNWKWGTSAGMSFVATGSFQLCGGALVDGGYYCAAPSPGNAWFLWWINPQTGQAKPVASVKSPAKSSGTDQWASLGMAADGFSTDSRGRIYAIQKDSTGKLILLQAAINDPNHTPMAPAIPWPAMGSPCPTVGSYSLTCTLNGIAGAVTWTDLTPGSLGADLYSQLANFTAGEPDAFVGSKFPSCYVSEVVQTKVKAFCFSGTQDTPGWEFRVEIGDGNPAHAGTAAGAHVDAAMNTWTYFPARFSVLHATMANGDPRWFQMTLNPVQRSATLAETSIPAYDSSSPIQTLTIASDVSDPTVNFLGIQPGDFLALNTSSTGYSVSTDEIVQVLSRTGGSITVKRGIGTVPTNSIPGPATIRAWGVDASLVPEAYAPNNMVTNTKVWWNADADPHGNNLGKYSVNGSNPFAYGPNLTVTKDAALTSAHQFYRAGLFAGAGAGRWQCPVNGWNGCYQTITGTVPDFFSMSVPENAVHTEQAAVGTFSGASAQSGAYQSHVSPPGVSASTVQKRLFYDVQPFGPQTPVNGTFRLAAGANQVWKLACTVADGTKPDDLTGNCVLNRKRMPTLAVAGRYGGVDISGPSALLQDTAADAYKYCVVRVAGECATGSAVGEVYVNLPNATTAGVCPVSGSSLMDSGQLYRNAACILNNSMAGMGVPQVTGGVSDPYGTLIRVLTTRLARYMVDDIFANSRMLPDNSWLMFRTLAMEDARATLLMAQIPPLAPVDNMSRSEFVPLPVRVTSVPAGTDNVTAEFGYEENRNPALYPMANNPIPPCTSRQEACIAYSAAPQRTVPFEYASSDLSPNGNNWNGQGVACASACTLIVPSISQHVMFYRIRYQQGSTVLATGPVQVLAAP